MKSFRKSTCLTDDGIDEILAACRVAMEKKRFSSDVIETYLGRVADVLDSYRTILGEGAALGYRIRRHFSRAELRLVLPGENYSPQEPDQEDAGHAVERAFGPLVRYQTLVVSHVYLAGHNVVCITSPRTQSEPILRSPTLWSAILGLVAGLLCLQLPDGIRESIVYDVAKPIQSLMFSLLTGIMVPVTFLSIITAISALGSVNELTNLGFKTVGRFITVTLSIMLVGASVSLIFYSVTGNGGADFKLSQIVDLLLGIIPTNVLAPLVEGNVPQIAVLAIALGAALLMLEGRGKEIRKLLVQLNDWFLSLMDIVMSIVPAIPFVCIFTITAEGAAAELLRGWEFIVAAYVSAIICGVFKILKVSHKFKVSVKTLWSKLLPTVKTAFVSGSAFSAMRQEYEISRTRMGIKPEYTSFWIPMKNAMFKPNNTLMFLIPPFLILKYTGVPVSISFLVMLAVLALQLSVAGPGTTGGWVILFGALGFSPDFVGMFITYRLACNNFYSGFYAFQAGLEQIEGAYRSDSLDLDQLRAD